MGKRDDSAGAIERLSALIVAQGSQIAALTQAIATGDRAGAQRAPAPMARHTLGDLYTKWAAAHSRLGSFKCDDARARRLLGIEPFELRTDEGLPRLVTWVHEDGPHAGVALSQRQASTLTGDDIDAWRVWYYLQTTRRKKPPTAATVNRYVMVLMRILNHAVKRNTIPRSPLLGYETDEEDNARAVVIEEAQLATLLDAFGDDTLMRAFVLLAYDSGMRLMELLCCRRTWLDPEAGFVHVPGAIAKNGEDRITDLSIRAYDACKALPKHIRTDILFPNPETAAPYAKRWIHERFVRAVEKSGIVGRDGTAPRIHDLRRSFVTLMDRRGVPRVVAMTKSGHKSTAVYKRYRIVDQGDLRNAWITMEAGRQKELAAMSQRREVSDPTAATHR